MPPKAPSNRLTHFLCIPLVTSASRLQLHKSLQAFRSDVKDDRSPENLNGIPEKAIRPLGTLHLTLGVMSLLTSERVDGALAFLNSLDISSLLAGPSVEPASSPGDGEGPSLPNEPNTDQRPLKITLRGLNSMHPPSETSILYSSPVDPDGRLQQFCNRLKGKFSDFLVPDSRPLLLHATIVNTVYVPGVRKITAGPGAGHGMNKARMTIDARKLLERYSEFTWMEDVKVEKVAICRMGARSIKNAEGEATGEEEYVVEGEIDLPPMEGSLS